MVGSFFTRPNNADMSTWTEWIHWMGGDCPMPWAEPGQYQLGLKSDKVADMSNLIPARQLTWQHGYRSFGESIDVIAFRYNKAANPEM